MNLEEIKLLNFRNYQEQTVKWAPGINLVYGQNAQGKTNLLEAVLFLLTGNSHRAANEAELIRYGQSEYYLSGLLCGKSRCQQLEVGRNTEGKFLRINQLPEKNRACLLGEVGAVIFAPEDLVLVKSGPERRRHFINALASQLWPRYYSLLVAYRRVLQQRNALLKQTREGLTQGETLPELNQQFAELASEIVKFRQRAVASLALLFQQNHQDIAGNQEQVGLTYAPLHVEASARPDEYLAVLKRRQREEISRGITLVGPHRDDLLIIVEQRQARQFASQGQQRTAVLALKLAELAMLKEAFGEAPVFLLDDVMSELDGQRREYLLQLLGSGVQTIITGTEAGIFGQHSDGWGIFQVYAGKIV